MSRARFLFSALWREKSRTLEKGLTYSCLKRLYCIKLTPNNKEIHDDRQVPADPVYIPLPKLVVDAAHEKRVLRLLNSIKENKKNVQVAKGIKLEESLVTDIVNFRSKNGKIGEVKDLLKANVVSFEHLQSLCTEVLRKTTQNSTFCYPAISSEKIKSLQSLVVIDLNLQSASWIKVNRDGKVDDWSHVSLNSTKIFRKFDHSFLYEVARSTLHQIPEGCCYIVKETMPKVGRNFTLHSMEIYSRVLRSIFMTLLKLKMEDMDEPNVHSVNVQKMPDIYNSSGNWFRYNANCDILKQSLDGELLNMWMLQIQPTFLDKYNTTSPDRLREQCASVALLANCFYNLVLWG
ncbi:transcription elongation factor, mitochondrial-like [Argopecten irradians]|uniref:transcription elongation factor, mitochondrial-like n=1 Tax=Argopecten irradians TaxID=31199 RepID=UPI00371D4CBD